MIYSESKTPIPAGAYKSKYRDFTTDELLELDVKSILDEMTDKDEIMDLASKWLDAKIERNQNPTDCENARYNFCRIYNNCGGGCVIHQTAYCFLVGLGTGRTNIIDRGWRYLRECETDDWTCAFESPSNCPAPNNIAAAPNIFNAKEEDRFSSVDLFSRGMGSQFVRWAASDGFHTNTPFYVPPELEKIRSIHDDVRVWIVGHVERYLLRLNEKKNHTLLDFTKDIREKFIHPIAGIHVRRTDHRNEAPFRDLKDYVELAVKWFDSENVPEGERRIYLATDEKLVIEEARRDFTQFTWLNYEHDGKPSGFTNEFLDQGRSSMGGFYSLMSDWWFLSRTDHFIGTSSSQVGRMAYELSQNYHTDAGKWMESLDDPWYFP